MTMAASDENALLLSALTMIFKMLRFGFFETSHIQRMAKPLIMLLDGRTDRVGVDETPSFGISRRKRAQTMTQRGGAGVMVFSTLQSGGSSTWSGGVNGLEAMGWGGVPGGDGGGRDGAGASPSHRGANSSRGGAGAHAGVSAESEEGGDGHHTRYELSSSSMVAMDSKVMICQILMQVCQLRVHVHMASALQTFARNSHVFASRKHNTRSLLSQRLSIPLRMRSLWLSRTTKRASLDSVSTSPSTHTRRVVPVNKSLRKSLFQSRSSMRVARDEALALIKRRINQEDLSLQALSGDYSVVGALLDLLMYRHDRLVSAGLALLIQHFHCFATVCDELDKVQLIVSDSTAYVFKKLQVVVPELRQLVEASEVWMNLDNMEHKNIAKRVRYMLGLLTDMMWMRCVAPCVPSRASLLLSFCLCFLAVAGLMKNARLAPDATRYSPCLLPRAHYPCRMCCVVLVLVLVLVFFVCFGFVCFLLGLGLFSVCLCGATFRFLAHTHSYGRQDITDRARRAAQSTRHRDAPPDGSSLVSTSQDTLQTYGAGATADSPGVDAAAGYTPIFDRKLRGRKLAVAFATRYGPQWRASRHHRDRVDRERQLLVFNMNVHELVLQLMVDGTTLWRQRESAGHLTRRFMRGTTKTFRACYRFLIVFVRRNPDHQLQVAAHMNMFRAHLHAHLCTPHIFTAVLANNLTLCRNVAMDVLRTCVDLIVELGHIPALLGPLFACVACACACRVGLGWVGLFVERLGALGVGGAVVCVVSTCEQLLLLLLLTHVSRGDVSCLLVLGICVCSSSFFFPFFPTGL